MIRIEDMGLGLVRLTTQPVAGVYPQNSIDISIQKGEGDVDIARNESDPHVPASDRVIIKRRGIQVAGGAATDFEDAGGTPYADADTLKATLDAFFFRDVSGGAAPIILTPTELIAEDTAGTLQPFALYSTEFIGGDGLTHTAYYSGTAGGKFPGAFQLLHANGESYEAIGIPQAAGATPITYAVDTIEVYSCRDFRGNSFVVSFDYIANLTTNPLWLFWWGDYRVQGNDIYNSLVGSADGTLTIEDGQTLPTSTSRFSRNTLHNSLAYVDNTALTGLDGPVIITGNELQVSDIYLSPGTVAWTNSLGCSFVNCKLKGCQINVQSFQGVSINTVTAIASSIDPTDTQFSLDNCDGYSFQIISTGTGDPSEAATINGATFSDTGIDASPPVAGTVTHIQLAIEGWASVTLDPNTGGHTGLKLGLRIVGGRVLLTSNLSVTKDATVGTDFSTGNLILDQPQDAYCGEVIFNGLSATSITPTSITTITAPNPHTGYQRALRLTAGLNSASGVPGYFRITVLAGSTVIATPTNDYRVIGAGLTTISRLGSVPSSQHLILRDDLTAPLWQLERNELYT